MFSQFRLAFRSLLSNKLRSALTMLGVAIGVAAVILLVSFGSGLSATIEKQFESVGPNVLFIVPGKLALNRDPGAVVNKFTTRDPKEIERSVDGVEGAVPLVESVVSVSSGGKTVKNTTLVGVPASVVKLLKFYTVADGQFFSQSDEDSAKSVTVVGPTVVTELFGGSSPIGKSLKVGGNRYLVVGVLVKRGSVFGQDQDNTVLIPITTTQKHLGVDKPQSIAVKVESGADVGKVSKDIQKYFLKKLTDDDFSVLTQEETLQTLQGVLGAVSAALAGIAGISLIVGGIGISNIMLVSVTERTREIGLRKAVGARPQDILRQFLAESVFLSVLGGTAGIVVGVGASLAINQFFTTVVTWWSIALAFGFSVLVGVIFGVLPAIRASRLNPIEALRYE